MSAKKLSFPDLVALHQSDEFAFQKVIAEAAEDFWFRVRFPDNEEEDFEFSLILNDTLEFTFFPDKRLYDNINAFGADSIFCDEGRRGETETLTFGEDGFRFQGYLFFVSVEDYQRMKQDAHKIFSEYRQLNSIPDTWFSGTFLIRFLKEVVSTHSVYQEILAKKKTPALSLKLSG